MWNIKRSKEGGMSAWEEYVHRITGGASQRDVGDRIGHSHTTARRWMSDGATPQQVIALAVAYNADILEALVAAGWLAEDDVKNVNLDGVLRKLSAVKLTAELYRRATEQEERRRRTKQPSVFDEPPPGL